MSSDPSDKQEGPLVGISYESGLILIRSGCHSPEWLSSEASYSCRLYFCPSQIQQQSPSPSLRGKLSKTSMTSSSAAVGAAPDPLKELPSALSSLILTSQNRRTGGTAGLVLANRLTESGDQRVLVLEAGQEPTIVAAYSAPGGNQFLKGKLVLSEPRPVMTKKQNR